MLGPYHAQYWSFVQGTVAHSGVPVTSNGGYISPYCAPPEPYFGSNLDGGDVHLHNDVHQNGLPGDPMYQDHRNSNGTNGIAAPDGAMYPAHIDQLGWQYPTVDPNLQTQGLQILDNLANQILSNVLTSSVQDLLTVATVSDTARGQAYATLLSLFDQNKKLFSRDRLFIDSQDPLHPHNQQYMRTMRKANLATFVACVFGGQNVPLIDLDEIFLEIFMPPGTRLLKSEGALLLELKTQAFIAIMLTNSVSKEELLERLFPRDLQLTILRRRQEPTHLAPSEQDFIGRLSTRRQYLSAGSDTYEALHQLPQKYSWKDFLDEVCICVRRALESMDAMKVSTLRQDVAMDGSDKSIQDIAQVSENQDPSSSMSQDPITKATLAAHAAISGARSDSNPFASSGSPDHAVVGQKRPSRGSLSPSTSSSTPMTVQYENARATTHPKAPPFTRRPGAPSQRRPWTQEEEKALMDGLDRVKGPHWSQILALYGNGGSISEVLKDRNQVQLKDKARNLKLFFLKSGIDVPVYLQRVTGELKTRAPAQAAKREAKERMKQMEEERARLGLSGSASSISEESTSSKPKT